MVKRSIAVSVAVVLACTPRDSGSCNSYLLHKLTLDRISAERVAIQRRDLGQSSTWAIEILTYIPSILSGTVGAVSWCVFDA